MDQADYASRHKRARAANAVSAIVSLIENNIAAGKWRPGFRLPTERALEAEFGVARNTLRKGLRRLEGAGKIVRLVGRGSFVAEPLPTSQPSPGSFLDRVVGASPADLMEVRLLLEPWAASLAAIRARAADLAHMHECLARAAAAEKPSDFQMWDGRLHEAIVASARNELLSVLYEAVNEARYQRDWISLNERSTLAEGLNVFQEQHSMIVAALCGRDPDLAAELSRAHLLAVRQSIEGSNYQT